MRSLLCLCLVFAGSVDPASSRGGRAASNTTTAATPPGIPGSRALSEGAGGWRPLEAAWLACPNFQASYAGAFLAHMTLVRLVTYDDRKTLEWASRELFNVITRGRPRDGRVSFPFEKGLPKFQGNGRSLKLAEIYGTADSSTSEKRTASEHAVRTADRPRHRHLFVNHLSGYEHAVTARRSENASRELIETVSTAAAAEHCKSLVPPPSVFPGNSTLAVVPFYGGSQGWGGQPLLGDSKDEAETGATTTATAAKTATPPAPAVDLGNAHARAPQHAKLDQVRHQVQHQVQHQQADQGERERVCVDVSRLGARW